MTVIDMNNLLIRYCFAIPEKLSPDGIMINGIYGLLRFINKIKTESIIFCADKCSKNFRKDILHSYKANRKPVENKIYTQIDFMISIANNLDIPVIVHDNYEADDLIASIVKYNNHEKFNVYSTDKDLLQLCVYDNVTLINPFSNEVLTEQTIQAKYGVSAKDFTMFLALMGDSADNIPGILGVGPKTATKIINEGREQYESKFNFDSLDLMVSLVQLYDKLPIKITNNPLNITKWNQQLYLLGVNF